MILKITIAKNCRHPWNKPVGPLIVTWLAHVTCIFFTAINFGTRTFLLHYVTLLFWDVLTGNWLSKNSRPLKKCQLWPWNLSQVKVMVFTQLFEIITFLDQLFIRPVFYSLDIFSLFQKLPFQLIHISGCVPSGKLPHL